jgi:hypothetical protein
VGESMFFRVWWARSGDYFDPVEEPIWGNKTQTHISASDTHN